MRFLDRTLERFGLVAAPPQWPPRRLSLALQGGGSFGAFTWGALERLLDEPEISFDAISGVSAGAVNAVLLASGLMEGGRAAAKARLERFWKRMSRAAALTPSAALAGLSLGLMTRALSPYLFNPFNLNPLREALSDEVDFARLQDAFAGAPADRRDAGRRRRRCACSRPAKSASTSCSPPPACR